MWLTCRQASELISGRVDRRPRPMERVRLRVHLLVCKACARVARQLGFLHRALAVLPKTLREE